MLISAQLVEAVLRRIRFFSRVARLSLIWQLALARGEIVSSTWLIATRRSSLTRELLPLVCVGSMFIAFRWHAEGIREREDDEREFESWIGLVRAVLDLILAGVEDELSGWSKTNVPSLLVLWVQSCSTRKDLKQRIVTKWLIFESIAAELVMQKAGSIFCGTHWSAEQPDFTCNFLNYLFARIHSK